MRPVSLEFFFGRTDTAFQRPDSFNIRCLVLVIKCTEPIFPLLAESYGISALIGSGLGAAFREGSKADSVLRGFPFGPLGSRYHLG